MSVIRTYISIYQDILLNLRGASMKNSALHFFSLYVLCLFRMLVIMGLHNFVFVIFPNLCSANDL